MSEFPERLETEILLDAHIDLAPPEAVGTTPIGERTIFIVTGGTFAGPKLRGTVRPGGGDWLLSLPNGAAELDVRATFETDDGALLYISYHGILDVTPTVVERVMAGEAVSAAEYYFRTTPRFETGAKQYEWLNKLVTVAYGRFGRNKVAYRIFAIR